MRFQSLFFMFFAPLCPVIFWPGELARAKMWALAAFKVKPAKFYPSHSYFWTILEKVLKVSLTERKKFLSARSWAEIQTSTINYHAAKLFQTCRSCSSNRANLNLPQRADVWLFLMFHLTFVKKKLL